RQLSPEERRGCPGAFRRGINKTPFGLSSLLAFDRLAFGGRFLRGFFGRFLRGFFLRRFLRDRQLGVLRSFAFGRSLLLRRRFLGGFLHSFFHRSTSPETLTNRQQESPLS
ncbi:MAG: hypothetical protein KAH44_06945, partial [Oricola sp.]|nr:hypothetical protein [Oricola sp.]